MSMKTTVHWTQRTDSLSIESSTVLSLIRREHRPGAFFYRGEGGLMQEAKCNWSTIWCTYAYFTTALTNVHTEQWTTCEHAQIVACLQRSYRKNGGWIWRWMYCKLICNVLVHTHLARPETSFFSIILWGIGGLFITVTLSKGQPTPRPLDCWLQ